VRNRGTVSERAVLSHASRRESTARSLAVVICREIDWHKHEGTYEANESIRDIIYTCYNIYYKNTMIQLFQSTLSFNLEQIYVLLIRSKLSVGSFRSRY